MGGSADHLRVLQEMDTTLVEGMFEVVKVFEGFIGSSLTNQRDNGFSRRELRGIGWSVEQDDARRNFEVFGSMPTCIVEHKDDDLVVIGVDVFSEMVQGNVHDFGGDTGQDQEVALASVWTDKNVDIQPLIAGTVTSDGSLTP